MSLHNQIRRIKSVLKGTNLHFQKELIKQTDNIFSIIYKSDVKLCPLNLK